MAVDFRAAGSIAVNTTTTTLSVTAPSCQVGDILLCALINKSVTANTFSPPDGTWTEVIAQEVNDCTTAADDHQYGLYWKRATASGGSFSFTKATDDNLLFAGVIAAYSGAKLNGSPIDATAPARTETAGASDNVSFPAFDPTSENVGYIRVAYYGNDATTFAGSDVKVETSSGNDCSIAFFSGQNNGESVAANTQASASSTDAGNTGVVFALVSEDSPNIKLDTGILDSYSESNLSEYSIVGGTSVERLAQSFTGDGKDITSVSFYVLRNANAAGTGNITAALYAHTGTYGSTGTPTGAALATSTAIAASTITMDKPTLLNLFFPTPYTSVNGTKYFISIEKAGEGSSLGLSVARDATSPSHGGNFADYEVSWTANSGVDLCFYLNEEHDFSTDTTPTLEFTGKDIDSDTLTYNTQVDTVSTFDSQTITGYTVDSYSESNQNADGNLNTGGAGVAQSFTNTYASTLKSCKFYLKKTGTPTGNMAIFIRAHSGTYGTSSIPTGAALATSDNFDVSTLTTSYVLYTINFSGANQISLSEETYYTIGTLFGGTVGSFVSFGKDTSSSSHSGNFSQIVAGPWVESATEDMCFYVYADRSSPLLNEFSASDSGFANTVSGGDTDPFNNNEKISFTVQGGDALSAGTYYWRVRAKDPGGANAYSTYASSAFTISAADSLHLLGLTGVGV